VPTGGSGTFCKRCRSVACSLGVPFLTWPKMGIDSTVLSFAQCIAVCRSQRLAKTIDHSASFASRKAVRKASRLDLAPGEDTPPARMATTRPPASRFFHPLLLIHDPCRWSWPPGMRHAPISVPMRRGLHRGRSRAGGARSTPQIFSHTTMLLALRHCTQLGLPRALPLRHRCPPSARRSRRLRAGVRSL
jgi:hypothetical protein